MAGRNMRPTIQLSQFVKRFDGFLKVVFGNFLLGHFCTGGDVVDDLGHAQVVQRGERLGHLRSPCVAAMPPQALVW